jgi:hypothetical protein
LLHLDSERYYNRLHLIFLEQNPEVKTFDLYRPAWEFLKDSPKFISITHANNAATTAASKQSLVPTDSSSPDTPALETPTQHAMRPMGKKKAKRMQEEDKILDNIKEKLSSEGHGNTGMILAGALTQFANVFASGLQEWRDRQAYSNASPTLRKRYDNLVMFARIQQLEGEATAKMNHLQPSNATDTAGNLHFSDEEN